MIFKLHYWFLTAGSSAQTILLGVFVKEYTDASTLEVGALFMLMPFVELFTKPFICSMADRRRAHRHFIMACLLILALGYLPFVIIPFLGDALSPRLCWYILAPVKILGDIGFGGALSLGDTMAINYAKRIGVEFNRIRMWGTISWFMFGLIIGQINEVWFLPKYTPGFMIIIAASTLNMAIFWLWPEEYFRIVAVKSSEASTSKLASGAALMPRDQVLTHMRRKVVGLFGCGSTNEAGASWEKAPAKKEAAQQVPQMPKLVQLKILAVLFRRDLRIVLYLCFFVLCGMALARNSFFYMSLADRCNSEDSCQFSSLTGFLQMDMAAIETLILYYIKRIMQVVGNVNTCTAFLVSAGSKNLFYGTIWLDTNPYWALLTELLQGVIFSIAAAITVEIGFKFSNEVQYIIPELIEREIIKPDDDMEVVRGSIAATMQGIVSSFTEGLGKGLGALIYGIIIDKSSYEQLWFGCGVVFSAFAFVSIAINVFDLAFQPHLGLDERHKLQAKGAQV